MSSNLNVAKAFLITSRNNSHSFLDEEIQLNEDYTLYYSSDTVIHSYMLGDQSVHLLGYALDIGSRTRSYLPILKKALHENLNSHAETVNQLNGSFVLIKTTGETIELFSDAAGFRSPYYHENLAAVASHDFILGELYEEIKYTDRNANMDYSRYRRIYKLVPSNKLIIGQQKERIFPDSSMTDMTYNQILSQVKKQIKNLNTQLDHIDNDIIIGLTGGVDSKCSLAFTNQLTKPVRTFTYMKDIKSIQNAMARRIYSYDKTIVSRIIKNIKLDHEFINFKVNDVDDRYSEELFKITGTTFNHPLAEQFEVKYQNKEDDVLQIRSVIFSNAKFDYEEKFKSKDSSLTDMYDYIKKKQFAGEDSEKTDNAITQYMERTHFSTDDNVLKMMDIFHIDSRMGNWHSQLVKETDRVMDFFNYLNDRHTLNMLLQLPLEVRENHLFHKDLIDTYWPILNFFDENNNGSLYEMKRNQILQTILSSIGEFVVMNILAEREFGREMQLVPEVDLEDTHAKQYIAEVTLKNDCLLRSNYNKKAGRDYIHVVISSGDEERIIDIVDLYEGYRLQKEQTYKIEIKFLKDKTTQSWKKAGTLLIC